MVINCFVGSVVVSYVTWHEEIQGREMFCWSASESEYRFD